MNRYLLALHQKRSEFQLAFDWSPGRGGGVLSYIGICRPNRVGFLRRFGLKTGIHFPNFGLESGMVLGELRECFFIQLSNN